MEGAIAKILIIEDDPEIGSVLTTLLEGVAYETEVATDGLRGLELALSGRFDLVLLDIALPGLNGLDVCRRAKAERPLLPIIMLTAQGEESDIVSGLEIGSDDYILKPFRPREVLARVRARLREADHRGQATSQTTASLLEDAPIVIGEIRIEPDKMRVFKRDELLNLSAREFEVVYLLASHAGKPFSRETLLAEIWGFESDNYSINVSVFLSRLRKKIENNPEQPTYLLTVRGVGYRFVEAAELSE